MTHHKGAGASRADWCTPEWVLQLAREVIGGPIGLDPATSPTNPTQALNFYTLADDGLRMPWSADSIFLNPPWSRKHGLPIGPWLERANQAYLTCRLRQRFDMFVVSSAAVNSKWWHRHVAHAERHFFPLGRIHFESPDPEFGVDSPQFDAEVAYFGTNPDVFESVFSARGRVLR